LEPSDSLPPKAGYSQMNYVTQRRFSSGLLTLILF
jgi:hypothetical protein